ncbi:MAG TPA: hypothetical protein VGR35_00065 [Tepidisphaeraceae bacterium]|nr:hypothetical protein [Tepidisphaeraceae bacterium]
MTDVLTLSTSDALDAQPYDQAPPSSRDAGAGSLRASAFFFAWSGYLFLHHSMVYYDWFRFSNDHGQREFNGFVVGLIVWIVAAASLLRRTIPWFAGLLIVHLLYEMPALPKTANHTFLTICMNVTMLAAIAVAAVRTRGRALLDPAPFFPHLAALLRLELLAMYFFVVLHKLNTDYFNPAYSCAIALYARIVREQPYLPSGAWVEPLCIYAAIGAEAAIPLLLLFRATRLWGVGLGLVFHLILSPHPNPFIYSFSALLYAAYFLFLPQDVLAEMVSVWGRLLSWLRDRWWWFALAAVLSGATVIGLRLLASQFVAQTRLIEHLHVYIAAGVRLAWNLIALFNIYAFARAVWLSRGRQARSADHGRVFEPFFRPAFTTPLLVFPLLVVFNGFCPYLGLKTESAFAMYANLRTEGARNNHLFMPRIDLANYQNDLVEFVDSSDGQLRTLKRLGYGWTWFEFRRNKLSRQKSDKFWVTFRRNGQEHTLRYAEHKHDPAFAPLPWYQRRLLYFRDVQIDPGPQHCGH